MPSVQSDVVVNTGPVLALAAAGYLHILRDLLTKVTILRRASKRSSPRLRLTAGVKRGLFGGIPIQ
jgi:hypothetical protein